MKIDNKNLRPETDELKEFVQEIQSNANNLKKVSIPENFIEFQKSIAPLIASLQDAAMPVVESLKTSLKEIQPIIEQAASIRANQFEILQKELKELSPKREKIINKMVSKGWTIGSNEGLYTVDCLEGMSAEDIDSYMMNYYSENNYEKMFDELDLLIETLDLGYKNQVLRIKQILEMDIDNYKIAIPTLFTVLEYVYDKELGFLDEDKIMKFVFVRDSKKNLMKNEKDDFLLVMLISAYSVLLDDLDNGQKSDMGFDKGTDGVKYSRHSVLHGRIDPDRLNVKNLIQLIVLISAIYTMASLERKYMEKTD